MFYTYVIQSARTSRFYVGSTEDVRVRLERHNGGKVASTENQRPWVLVFTQQFVTRAEAVRRELEIKNWKNPRFMCEQLGIHKAGG